MLLVHARIKVSFCVNKDRLHDEVFIFLSFSFFLDSSNAYKAVQRGLFLMASTTLIMVVIISRLLIHWWKFLCLLSTEMSDQAIFNPIFIAWLICLLLYDYYIARQNVNSYQNLQERLDQTQVQQILYMYQ